MTFGAIYFESWLCSRSVPYKSAPAPFEQQSSHPPYINSNDNQTAIDLEQDDLLFEQPHKRLCPRGSLHRGTSPSTPRSHTQVRQMLNLSRHLLQRRKARAVKTSVRTCLRRTLPPGLDHKIKISTLVSTFLNLFSLLDTCCTPPSLIL